MSDYGLPMKFKMTCRKTGRDSLANELDFDRTPNPLAGANLYQIQGTGASNFDEDPVIRQATGFTDAAGKDVYFGDVLMLMYPDGKTVVSLIVDVDHRYGSISARATDGSKMIHADRFSGCHIVGNAYEPPARWIERARAIWPDAQLPEGVRG